MTASRPRVRVLVLQHGLGALDYAVPDDLDLGYGDIVEVPLGPRTIVGVVWEADRWAAREVPDAKLRPVVRRFDVPAMTAGLRRLIEWTGAYYMAPPAAVLRMALSVSSALVAAADVTEYRLGTISDKLTPLRAAAVERLDGRQGSVRELARHGGVSEGVIRGMVKAAILVPIAVSPDTPPPLPDPDFAQPVLSYEQAVAAEDIARAVDLHEFAPFVLDGVTGSGKTEVYFEGIAAALRSESERGAPSTMQAHGPPPPKTGEDFESNEADGPLNSPPSSGEGDRAAWRGGGGGTATGQTLVLVPEIALTAPWLDRFAARFGCPPVSWHSDLRGSERRRAWRAVANGTARVVVGARSALFLPYADLRLIIVDEAHESSFKQDEGVQYHARDVAVMRAQIDGIAVVLATATPAIETRVQVARGRYTELKLPTRFGGAQLPRVETIDLRTNPPPRGNWLSPPLVHALRETFVAGEQSLLFLNRRGYAPLTLCRSCGERIECPQCTAWLVEHRLTGRLQCHHCGYSVPVPKLCPACGAADSLVPCGPGVERVAEEVARVLPDLRVALVTSDTIFSPARAAALVASVEAREVDLLIGTQLVTKGYHFPDLTLVGVVDADLGLAGGDLRAGERTFQQIAQVSGRAGRGARPGRVLLQTHQPEARIMRALVEYDAEGFYAAETDARRDLGLPPFGRLAGIVVSGEDDAAVTATARALGRSAPQAEGLAVLGPAPAPLAMLRGRHRQRLLVHARRSLDLQGIIAAWLDGVDVPASVRVTVDIDPYNFL
ncbi:replication restart helicase PriA [Glacieibacterium megasporae]|uniref:replication restart helicase PriA n=1 Tax=Glacieibacterium megasporae TaxID=2835787 RepID=UPI0021031540|nr:primosomal protein N' [Polymorphobacter megasporae]